MNDRKCSSGTLTTISRHQNTRYSPPVLSCIERTAPITQCPVLLRNNKYPRFFKMADLSACRWRAQTSKLREIGNRLVRMKLKVRAGHGLAGPVDSAPSWQRRHVRGWRGDRSDRPVDRRRHSQGLHVDLRHCLTLHTDALAPTTKAHAAILTCRLHDTTASWWRGNRTFFVTIKRLTALTRASCSLAPFLFVTTMNF